MGGWVPPPSVPSPLPVKLGDFGFAKVLRQLQSPDCSVEAAAATPDCSVEGD